MIFIPVLLAAALLGVFAYKIGHRRNGNKGRSWAITLMSIIFGITVLVAGILLVVVLDPDVQVVGDRIQVSGLYKRDIHLEDVEDVSLKKELPVIQDQVNGLSIGNTLRGTFRIEGGEISTMFVQKNTPPFIHIRTGERLFVINFRDSQETEDLYGEIMEELE
ncbi:MAG TPA: hypothetical protein VFD79_04235 [Tissierellaceae bacterium]|jgi:hypothetical protein|nr:hypothetical protein [Tissierellaceae bacterium]